MTSSEIPTTSDPAHLACDRALEMIRQQTWSMADVVECLDQARTSLGERALCRPDGLSPDTTSRVMRVVGLFNLLQAVASSENNSAMHHLSQGEYFCKASIVTVLSRSCVSKERTLLKSKGNSTNRQNIANVDWPIKRVLFRGLLALSAYDLAENVCISQPKRLAKPSRCDARLLLARQLTDNEDNFSELDFAALEEARLAHTFATKPDSKFLNWHPQAGLTTESEFALLSRVLDATVTRACGEGLFWSW